MYKKDILIGSHVSISGGIQNSILRANELGINCFQIFVKNNRQWAPRHPKKNEIEEFKSNLEKYAIKSVIAHATYLINLCSANDIVKSRSYEALVFELKLCSELKIPYIVLHPGSSANTQCIKKIAQAINHIYKNNNIYTKIALETMAGQGNTFGHSFESLRDIYKDIDDKSKVGFCLDTCHIFASGYNIKDKEGYEAVLKEFDNILGLEKIKIIHLNDSKKKLGSKIDRHEHIGSGEIGLQAFELILNESRFQDIPKILETPKEEVTDDIKNINTLLKLIK